MVMNNLKSDLKLAGEAGGLSIIVKLTSILYLMGFVLSE